MSTTVVDLWRWHGSRQAWVCTVSNCCAVIVPETGDQMSHVIRAMSLHTTTKHRDALTY